MEQQEFFPGNRIEKVRINCSDERHDTFVTELFLNNMNQTAAAIKAGYAEKSARRTGSKLMTNAYIIQQIALKRQELRDRDNYSVDRVLVELGRVATSDAREGFYADGGRIPIHLLDDHASAGVAGYEFDEAGRLCKVRYFDKNAALSQLARIHGINRDKSEVKVTHSLEDLVAGGVDGNA